MESNDLRALSELYLKTVYEAKAESPEEEEEKMKKDDDLAGSPNKKKNGKKADKDYDGDGKVESSKDEYFGSKDKAIKKAMGKDVKEARWWDVDVNEAVYGGKKEAPKDTRMVVTNADKKANTKAYQNMKAGVKGYKAADHMGEEKKAAKDYDGDGKIESGKDEYFGSKDKAIKKAMGKKIKEGMSNWRHDLKEIPDYDQIPLNDKKRNEKISEKNVKNTIKINPEMKEGYGDKKKKKHDCASKVKHEQFGVGNCISEAHDLDENGNVAHYDVEFGKYLVTNVPVEDLEILEGHMHEHAIREGVYEKQKTKEVMGALKKRDLKQDVKKKIAADIVKRKGDTSKSDDRYAYENYQAMRNPEKYERDQEKSDKRSAREKRMADPKKGINSPAFKEFMRSRGM